MLALGNMEGACSRAYYAVFYAAQAALIVEGFGDEVSSIKTHTGLLGFFSRRLIKTGRLAIGLSKTLNKLHDLRLSADYLTEASSREEGIAAIEHAETFLQGISVMLPKP